MKNTLLLAVISASISLGSAPITVAQDEDARIAMEEIRRLCNEWAEEDGLEGEEKSTFIELCIREEMEAIGLEVPHTEKS